MRGERALRGRRLRAGAGLRLDRDGRRRLHHGGPARGAAPRRAARHRRAHPAGGQAPGSPRPRRLLLHARGGDQGPAGGGVGTGGRGGAALPARGDGKRRAAELAARTDRPAAARGIALTPLARTHRGRPHRLRHVTCVARPRRAAWPRSPWRLRDGRRPPTSPAIHAQGAEFWPLALARELDDLILHLRSQRGGGRPLGAPDHRGAPTLVEAHDRLLLRHQATGSCARSGSTSSACFKRLDVSSRSLFALVEPGSCFAGTLLELALAADRSYMLDGRARGRRATRADAAPDRR